MQIIVDGMLTNYTSSGSGENVLLLHGWGDNLHTFDHLTLILSPKYRVLALDLPGFGNTEKPESPYNLELYTKFVKDFLVKIEVNKVYCIIGHSNGGAITIKGLSNNVLHTKKLILLASSGVRSTYRTHNKISRIVYKTAKIPTYLLPRRTQEKIKKRVYKQLGSDMFVKEDMQDTFKNVVSEDIVNDSKKIKAETLLIYGNLDESTPSNYGKLFNMSIKDSRLEIIKDSGHFIHHDKSSVVEELIMDFLEQK